MPEGHQTNQQHHGRRQSPPFQLLSCTACCHALSCSASGQVVLSNFPNGAKLRSLLHKGTRAGCLGFAPQQPNLLCGAKGSGQLLVWDTDQASQAPEEYNVHRVRRE